MSNTQPNWLPPLFSSRGSVAFESTEPEFVVTALEFIRHAGFGDYRKESMRRLTANEGRKQN